MSARPRKKRRGLWITLAALAAAIAALWIGLAVYASGCAQGGEVAKACIAAGGRRDNGVLTFGLPEAPTGIILYPGGLVDADAYAPLGSLLARDGAFVAIPSVPYHLAVFDRDCAAAVMAEHAGIGRWIVGGHSLGGAMAASFAAAHPARVSGVILLAAYSTEPLQVPALSLYGDADTVLNAEKYATYRRNLPAGATRELVIPGGNHAQFGDYGAQEGDAPAAISGEEQRALAASAIMDWLATLEQEDAA